MRIDSGVVVDGSPCASIRDCTEARVRGGLCKTEHFRKRFHEAAAPNRRWNREERRQACQAPTETMRQRRPA